MASNETILYFFIILAALMCSFGVYYNNVGQLYVKVYDFTSKIFYFINFEWILFDWWSILFCDFPPFGSLQVIRVRQTTQTSRNYFSALGGSSEMIITCLERSISALYRTKTINYVMLILLVHHCLEIRHFLPYVTLTLLFTSSSSRTFTNSFSAYTESSEMIFTLMERSFITLMKMISFILLWLILFVQ